MKKAMACILCLALCLACVSSALGEKLTISLNPAEWLGKTVTAAGRALEQLGYKPDPDNKKGIMKDIAWRYDKAGLCPETVNLWFDSDNHRVTMLVCVFAKNLETYEQLYQSLTLLYGEPSHSEQWKDVQERITVTYPEAYTWTGDTVTYSLVPANHSDGSLGTFQEVKEEKTGFSIRMLQREEKETSASKATAKPTSKPKPTATPKPVKLEIAIDNVEIKDTRYGTREFYIRFKNNASVTVDRIDFRVQGYNRYGERIKQYNIDAVDFYSDEELKPGKVTPKDYYYNYYMLDEATKIKIAILRYHMTNGKTVEVPESQLKWYTFEK